MHVAALAVHPLKSSAIRPVRSAEVGAAGLRGDREWMVVDADGELVSARELPALFGVVAETRETGGTEADLLLTHAAADPIEVAVPAEGSRDVTLFGRHHLTARPAAAGASDWLRAVTGRDDISLVHCSDPAARTLSAHIGGPDDRAAFQDASPVSILSTASVERIGAWMADEAAERGEEPPAPLPAGRFRPNILVEEAEAFAEDGWERIAIGDVVLRRARPISRCVMTTIDPDDLSRGREPIRTLARHRRWDGKTWVAVHLVPERIGRIHVGDEVVPG